MYMYVCIRVYVKKGPSNLDGRKRIPVFCTHYTMKAGWFFLFVLCTISIDCFG